MWKWNKNLLLTLWNLIFQKECRNKHNWWLELCSTCNSSDLCTELPCGGNTFTGIEANFCYFSLLIRFSITLKRKLKITKVIISEFSEVTIWNNIEICRKDIWRLLEKSQGVSNSIEILQAVPLCFYSQTGIFLCNMNDECPSHLNWILSNDYGYCLWYN